MEAALLRAFELAAEGGRGLPVAKRAAADANRGRSLLLGHPLAEQSPGPPLLLPALLAAAAPVGELLLCSPARALPPAGGEPARTGGLGRAGALRRLDGRAPGQPVPHLLERQPIPAPAVTLLGEAAIELLADRDRIPTLCVRLRVGERQLGRRTDLQLPQPLAWVIGDADLEPLKPPARDHVHVCPLAVRAAHSRSLL